MPKSFSNRPSRKSAFSAPAPVRSSAPVPAPSSGPSMKDSMKQGFGLGLGLEGARAAIGAIGSVFSSGDNSQQQQQTAPLHTQSQPTSQSVPSSSDEPTEVCGLERKLFERCLDETGDVDNQCADFFKLYEKCSNKI